MHDQYTLTTSTGGRINLQSVSPSGISAVDIAAALSKMCRFGAHATRFYSVAQHAIEVAALVPPPLRLAALHHDSHEAFAGDLPTPLKRLLRSESAVYDNVRLRLDDAIASALGLDARDFGDPVIKDADAAVLVWEARTLLADGGRALEVTPSAASLAATLGSTPLSPLAPEEAERAFLEAHNAYTSDPG